MIAHRSSPLSHLEGDAELVSLNGGTIIPSYPSPPSGREVLSFISHPFRITQGLVIKESSFVSIASDSCKDHAAKKEELSYVRAVVDGVMATNYFSCQPPPSGTARGMVTALKRAMAHADVDLDVWIRKLFFYCEDAASVVQGECGGIIRIVGDLQKEIAGYDVVVPYHAYCHRCELAFKAAIGTNHAFLDLLADTLQSAALFWNAAPSRLKTLHAMALALDAAFLKLGVLHTRRWCAFKADPLRRMKRCYVIVSLGLCEVHVSKAVHKEQRDALLFALTNEVFLCGLFFMLDVVQASAVMSQGVQVTKRYSALIDRRVEACVAELDKVARWEGDEWLAFNAALVSHEGSHTPFYGVPLHNSNGRTEFMTQASDFVARARDELVSRFVNTHPVAKATSFLDFFGWPWHDSVALAWHATDCITTIRDHFQSEKSQGQARKAGQAEESLES